MVAHRWGGTYGMVDRAKVALLGEVVARTGCQVVVSSTWRSDDRFRAGMRRRGARFRYHRDWRTAKLPDDAPYHRGREIAEWLSRNPASRYAIVDDGDDMLPEQRDRHVRTDYATGLLPRHVEDLVALLST